LPRGGHLWVHVANRGCRGIRREGPREHDSALSTKLSEPSHQTDHLFVIISLK
jgi:hypothetical protein